MSFYKLTFKFLIWVAALVLPFSAYANLTENHNVIKLSSNSAFIKLLHYKQTFGGHYRGLVANDDFYLSPDGRNNPLAELKAEVAAFGAADGERCRFPARFRLLKSWHMVNGDLAKCSDYQRFIKDIQPKGITVLFTNAYMGNPASMFGHTLVRIDTNRKGSQMLAHGSNFGANTGMDQGLVFALKGLFGFYQGGYNLSPYWTIINTYNNIENRDIYEYHLNLTHQENQKFIDHLYEMKSAWVRYFFLKLNCSYMLLELLEAVRPSLNLTAKYNYWAIPLDTLKTIKSVPNLVDDVHYRPARYTKIKAMLSKMNAEQYAAFLNGINNHDYEMPALSLEEKAEVLEAQYQYYQYQYVANKMELKEYRQNSFAVLRKRSQMPALGEQKIAWQEPSLSHGAAQISLSGGAFKHKSFAEIMLRPAYSDITDDSYGLINGAGIKVMESKWRYYNQKRQFVLQSFTPLHIDSFVPANRVFSPLSYITNADVHREYNPQTKAEGYVADIHFAIGKTYALYKNFMVYALGGAGGQYGGLFKENYWLGFMPTFGFFANWEKLRINTALKKTYATAKFGDTLRYEATIACGLTRNLVAETKYSITHSRGHNIKEYMLSLRQAF